MATRGVNKVTLLGNLGRDPEVRFTENNLAVCTVSLATSMKYRKRDTSEEVEKTEWHRLVFFGRLAEIASEYLKKGSSIFVEGRLQTRDWEDKKTGEKRYMTEVVVGDMIMLGRRGDDRSGGGDAPSDDKMDTGSGSGGDKDFDDEVPF